MYEPKYIACHYLPHSIVPTVAHLEDAYRAATLQAQWIELSYRKLPVRTKPYQCWFNVQKAISAWGGSMQCGWLFRIDPVEESKNCLADIETRPHAVWRSPKGELIEVSADCRGMQFLASDVVVPHLAINVGFVDSLMLARTYRPSNPFQPYCNKYCEAPKTTTGNVWRLFEHVLGGSG